MMWKEFEKLAGYEVTYSDYHDIIEPMYMALPNVGKAEFIGMIDKKRFALPTREKMIRDMRKKAEEIEAIVEHTGAYSLKEELRKMAYAYAGRFHGFDRHDLNTYCYFRDDYTLPGMRGCSFPFELVIGDTKHGDWETVRLINRGH